MKKLTTITLTLALLLSSCNKEFENAMKSADKDVILNAANEYYAQKDWRKALALYERLPKLVAGTSDAADVNFKSAYANYYDKNYRLAAHQFKSFALANPRDTRREEAAYMSAICYYQGSLDYNLDQENTLSAIDELQSFLDNYPNSKRGENINQLIDELTYKLEFKHYEIARQYFKMADYKAADISFENMLEDYPSTKLKPKVINYRMKAKKRLAVNSVFSKKEERLASAISFTQRVLKEYPTGTNAEDAKRILEDLKNEQKDFAAVKKTQEAKIAARKAKLARAEKEDINS